MNLFPSHDAGLPARPLVKICGLTCPADAELAIELGAGALGFNFYPPSPRSLNPKIDGEWIRRLPTAAHKIAVVINPTPEEIQRLADEGVADAFQLHGNETEEDCAALRQTGCQFIKAIRVRDETDLLRPERFGCRVLVLDAFSPAAFGGTGRRIDWTLAARFVAEQAGQREIILSGGLTPENVAEGIRQVRPAGVDVASGVEGADGPRHKDPARLRAFLAAALQA